MIKKIKKNVWQFYFKEFSSCVYVLKLKKLILIDTGSKNAQPELLTDLKKLNINPEDIEIIILTHKHYDHIGNLDLFPRAEVFTEKNITELKIPELKIIKTPGHTREDICILYRDILFSGDVIFDKNHVYVGRTDLPESSPEKM